MILISYDIILWYASKDVSYRAPVCHYRLFILHVLSRALLATTQTAEIRRQFKRIKRARETDVAKGRSPAGVRGAGSPRSPIRVKPMINRHQPRAPDTSTGKGPSTAQSPVRAPSRRSGGKRPPVVSPKKPAAPVSPRKTPGKRGVSTRPAPSPKSGDSSAKRAAGGGRSSAPPTQTQSQIIPATPNSPVVTRGKGIRAPSKLPDSPVSSPRKRAEAGGDRMGGSPGGSTPAKRGAPSTLQLARFVSREKSSTKKRDTRLRSTYR